FLYRLDGNDRILVLDGEKLERCNSGWIEFDSKVSQSQSTQEIDGAEGLPQRHRAAALERSGDDPGGGLDNNGRGHGIDVLAAGNSPSRSAPISSHDLHCELLCGTSQRVHRSRCGRVRIAHITERVGTQIAMETAHRQVP